jgi:hypothetical protein
VKEAVNKAFEKQTAKPTADEKRSVIITGAVSAKPHPTNLPKAKSEVVSVKVPDRNS